MLDFVCELDRQIKLWPEDIKLTPLELAEATHSIVPKVIDCLSDALGRDLDVQEKLNLKDFIQALNILKQRLHSQLAARERRLQDQRDRAIRAYDLTMDKVRILQMNKNWRNAYKTLSYYVGKYEKNISADLITSICGECLRLGIKAEINLQELGRWLNKGISTCLATKSMDAMEDALDFIDAYGDHFTNDPTGKGTKLLNNSLARLHAPTEPVQAPAPVIINTPRLSDLV